MRFYLAITILLISLFSFSQTSIKYNKPKNVFFYSQLSARGGGQFDLNSASEPWLFSSSSKGQRTRLTNQLFFRSKKTLQKGYISKLGLRNGCFALSIDYDPFYYGTNKKAALQLRLMDSWLGFGTKKSRRNFWIGNRRVEYGRSHRIEAETSFMNRNSLRVRDFGFWWDLGVVYRSPIIKDVENRWDATLQISSGGWLFNGNGSQGTFWFMGAEQKDSISYLNFFTPEINYENTYLAIANIGRPTYFQKDWNFFGAIGNIRDQYNLDSTVVISRFGAEYIFKRKESLKFGNQLSIGNNFYQDGRSFHILNLNNTFDYNFFGNYVFSVSQFVGFQQGINNKEKYIDYSIVSSIAYVFNPDLKLRLNLFYDNEDHWNERNHIGAYIQLVAGLGRRL